MKGFRVAEAAAKDIEVLVRQRHMMFEEMRHPSEAQHRAADSTYRRWARSRLRSGKLRGVLVIAPGGKVAAGGCVWLREVQPAPGRAARVMPYLMSMYTEPEFRRRGLASLIVKDSMNWARKNGYARMTLHASEAGRRVYSRLGWDRSWEMRADLSGPSVRRKKGATAARARS